jgi:hypothetical protein
MQTRSIIPKRLLTDISRLKPPAGKKGGPFYEFLYVEQERKEAEELAESILKIRRAGELITEDEIAKFLRDWTLHSLDREGVHDEASAADQVRTQRPITMFLIDRAVSSGEIPRIAVRRVMSKFPTEGLAAQERERLRTAKWPLPPSAAEREAIQNRVYDIARATEDDWLNLLESRVEDMHVTGEPVEALEEDARAVHLAEQVAASIYRVYPFFVPLGAARLAMKNRGGHIVKTFYIYEMSREELVRWIGRHPGEPLPGLESKIIRSPLLYNGRESGFHFIYDSIGPLIVQAYDRLQWQSAARSAGLGAFKLRVRRNRYTIGSRHKSTRLVKQRTTPFQSYTCMPRFAASTSQTATNTHKFQDRNCER